MSSSQHIEQPAMNPDALKPDLQIQIQWNRERGHQAITMSGAGECLPPVLDVVDRRSYDRAVHEAKQSAKYGQVSDLRTQLILQQDVIDLYEETLVEIGTPEALAALEIARDPEAIRRRRFEVNQ